MSLISFALALALTQTTAPPTFPDTFLGQWTEDIANCGVEDTQGVKVEPDRMEFYEAVGHVQSVTVERNGAVVSKLSFTGEGRSWTETAYLRLANDLASMEMHALGQKLVLSRCPVVLDL